MRSRSRVLAILPLLALASACAAKTPAASLPANPALPAAEDAAPHIARIEHGLFLGARIEGDPGLALADRMRAHHVHGLSIAVIHHHRIAWAKGYGLADAESGKAVTDATLFQAGSISKPVTAMAALRLIQDGKLALEARVNDVLTSWKLPENDLTRATPVTMRHILSHTAGTTVHGFPGYAAGEPVPTLLQVLDGRPPANSAPIRVDLAPGTKFRYSGGGTSILQQALIDRTGKPFPQLLAETVLGPTGMDHSTYEQPLPAGRVPFAAAGYDSDGNPIPGKRHVYPEMAAAGLWTTPTDLARFGLEIALASSGKASRVISQATANLMLTEVAPTDNPDGGVALGVFVSRHEGALYFGHDGADDGFQALLLASAERGYGVAMMANSDDGLPLMREVLGAVATEYGWEGFGQPLKLATLAPARLSELSGAYQLNVDRVCHFAVEGDHLVLRAPFQPPMALLPVSDTTFVRREDDARYTFSKAADGSFQLTRTPATGEWPVGKRVADTLSLGLDDVAAGRLEQAEQWYRATSVKAPHEPALGEERFNNLGLGAVRHRDFPAAILLLRLNTMRFPDSMNTHDSLAYAYQRSGDKAQAMASYERSLATFARDTTTPASVKEGLRKNALNELNKLGAPHR